MDYQEFETRMGAHMTSCLRDVSIRSQEQLIQELWDFGKAQGVSEDEIQRAIKACAMQIRESQA